MSTGAAWLPLVEAIEYVAYESDKARTWALGRFKDSADPAGKKSFFAGPIAASTLREVLSEGLVGASLQADAIAAIQDAAMAGKLRCRGVDPGSAESVEIEAGEWAHIEVSAEGEAFRVLKRGAKSIQICRRVVWQNIVVEGRQLRRLFPRSSGKGGTGAAETHCGAWLKRFEPNPARRKSDVWEEAGRQWGEKLSRGAFDRCWEAHAPEEWKQPGRPPKVRG
jgi:hypothetical protein